MELDDLKQAWKQEENKHTKTPDIMEMIHQKSRGPIASLKTAYRKQMIAVIAMLAIVIATQAKNVDSVSSHLLFWTFIGFAISMILAFNYNYRQTAKMESMEGDVKSHLEQHVSLMEKRLKWQNIGARLVIVFFILLIEIIPHFQNLRILSKWHSLSPIIRFSSYVAYMIFQYFLSRGVTQNKFGRHLDRLKALLQELK